MARARPAPLALLTSRPRRQAAPVSGLAGSTLLDILGRRSAAAGETSSSAGNGFPAFTAEFGARDIRLGIRPAVVGNELRLNEHEYSAEDGEIRTRTGT